ncbi:hypothetical protein SAMN04487905_11828 [Actinopolyspora xinjiangensis]|uniref:Uncharacterized protein n=1 Tax=Actinopolyspora xinjiangensis TaxID=405564 RepID=A0A1H0WYD6_9ACTN|nr:hypothetical protein SAMN04487905_11828 [Actinopolyspora xinjiangensis]
MPLQILSRADVQVIEETASAQWRELTLEPYRHDSLPGGHFYASEMWRALPTHITVIDR